MALKVVVFFEDMEDEDYELLMQTLKEFGATDIADETVADDPDKPARPRAKKKER